MSYMYDLAKGYAQCYNYTVDKNNILTKECGNRPEKSEKTISNMSRTKVILISLMIFGASYYLYTPLPDNAREPWKQRLMAAVFRVMFDLSSFGEKIGYDSYINTTRNFFEGLGYLMKERDDGSLKVIDTNFNGTKVRIYRPIKSEGDLPALIYMHGGGWMLLSVEGYDHVTRRIAKHGNIIVVSIDYRRAPEHPFPIPFEDCVSATKHLLKHGKEYGVDTSRIGIAGDSAGGNLAMAISLKLSREGNLNLPKLKMMGLIYPALQAFDMNTPAYQIFQGRNGPCFLTKEVMIFFYTFHGFGEMKYFKEFSANEHTSSAVKKSKLAGYVSTDLLPPDLKKNYQPPNLQGSNEQIASECKEWLLNPYFAPLLVSDEEIRKLPKTYLLTVEYDVLRDDGWILAERMKNINHPLQHKHWEGVEHAFIWQKLYDSSFEFTKHFTAYLNTNL